MPEPNEGWDEDQQDQFSILNAFLTTCHHFFGDFGALIQSVDDPRRPELIIYRIQPDRVRFMREWALEYHEVPV